MFEIKIERNILRIIDLYYRIGFWRNEPAAGKRSFNFFYLIYYPFFLVSLVTGAMSRENQMNEKVVLFEGSMIDIVLLVKVVYLIWKQREIIEHLNRICCYSVADQKTFVAISDKRSLFMRFVPLFLCGTCFAGISLAFVAPLVGADRKLFLPVGFPLDWRNSEFSYWVAYAFVSTQVVISLIPISFSVIIWYLIANCGWRYEILGQQMEQVGNVRYKGRLMSHIEIDNLYVKGFIQAIDSRKPLIEMTNQLELFLSKIFAVQLTTSALGICASIYSIVFVRGDNIMELSIYFIVLLYNTFDIFMIMYFGNETKLASDRLSHQLYESNWIDRSQWIKNNMIIFEEFLRQPQQLSVMKVFPLKLETFTSVLQFAYSSFNILKNF